jgi:rare lipoprotein A
MALAACAPSTFVTDKSALLENGQRRDNNHSSSAVTERRVAAQKNRRGPTRTRDSSFGVASYYRDGSRTANGEKFDQHALTAASPSLPFGTRLRVTNVANGRSVVVRINDRGPFVPGRIVDVSSSAAETLGMIGQGTAKVKLEVER